MTLLGHVGTLTHRRIVGWAWDKTAPDAPVTVLVAIERRVLGRCRAEEYRADIVAAGVGGVALPGCECGSVPVARRLFGDGGVTGAAALTFMLAAPAINPVVLVATAVAFPGNPQMVVARCVASLMTAMIMGALWARWGRVDWVPQCERRVQPGSRDVPADSSSVDLTPRPSFDKPMMAVDVPSWAGLMVILNVRSISAIVAASKRRQSAATLFTLLVRATATPVCGLCLYRQYFKASSTSRRSRNIAPSPCSARMDGAR